MTFIRFVLLSSLDRRILFLYCVSLIHSYTLLVIQGKKERMTATSWREKVTLSLMYSLSCFCVHLLLMKKMTDEVNKETELFVCRERNACLRHTDSSFACQGKSRVVKNTCRGASLILFWSISGRPF